MSVKPRTQDTLFLLIKSPPNTQSFLGTNLWWSVSGLFLQHSGTGWSFLNPLGIPLRCRLLVNLSWGNADQCCFCVDQCPSGYKPSLDVCCRGKAWSLRLDRTKSPLFHSIWMTLDKLPNLSEPRNYHSIGLPSGVCEFHKQGPVRALSEVHWQILNNNTNFIFF